MTRNNADIDRLIADVEDMSHEQRLIFIELLLKSFRDHELPQYLGRFQLAVGRARLVKKIDLVKKTRKTPIKKL